MKKLIKKFLKWRCLCKLSKITEEIIELVVKIEFYKQLKCPLTGTVSESTVKQMADYKARLEILKYRKIQLEDQHIKYL